MIMVVGIREGCINHALLTAQAIANDGLPLIGWVANRINPGLAHYAEIIDVLSKSCPPAGGRTALSAPRRAARISALYRSLGFRRYAGRRSSRGVAFSTIPTPQHRQPANREVKILPGHLTDHQGRHDWRMRCGGEQRRHSRQPKQDRRLRARKPQRKDLRKQHSRCHTNEQGWREHASRRAGPAACQYRQQLANKDASNHRQQRRRLQNA